MPPKRRRRFQGLYYHSSPPKVLPMNGHLPNESGRKRRESDDFSVKLSTIRIWMHEKDIGKLTRILWAGQGNRLRQQASTNPKVKRFLAAVPHVMNSIRDVHQAVIDNNLENLQTNLEPPVPPALVTCRDANGLNLIHKAAGLGHATILEYLITTWPDGVHECDITGKTPLHWAASAKNNMRCYTLLTQAGSDEESVDYKMKTPSFYRHKPNEIERAFLTYIPEAPRVSPDIATDWEALSDDSGDGKKLGIKIPEMNGFARHSNAESNENTSEAEMTEVSAADDEDAGGGGEEEPAEENALAEEEEAVAEEPEDEDEPELAEENEDAKEDEEEAEEDNEAEVEPQDEKQTQSVSESNADTNHESEDNAEQDTENKDNDNEESAEGEAIEATEENNESEVIDDSAKEAKESEESDTANKDDDKGEEDELESPKNNDITEQKENEELEQEKEVKEETQESVTGEIITETTETSSNKDLDEAEEINEKEKEADKANSDNEDDLKDIDKSQKEQDKEEISEEAEDNDKSHKEQEKEEESTAAEETKENNDEMASQEEGKHDEQTDYNKDIEQDKEDTMDEEAKESIIIKERITPIENFTGKEHDDVESTSDNENDNAENEKETAKNDQIETPKSGGRTPTETESQAKELEKTEEDENNNTTPTNDDDVEDNDKDVENEDDARELSKTKLSNISEESHENGEGFLKEAQQEISDKFEEISDNLIENVKVLSNKIKNVFTSPDENENENNTTEDQVDPKSKVNANDNGNESNDVIVRTASHKTSSKSKAHKENGRHGGNGESSDDTNDDEDEEPEVTVEDSNENEQQANEGETNDNADGGANAEDDADADGDVNDDQDDDGGAESPTSSLAIEGFVHGDSEDNTVQSQTAAYVDDDNDDEETRISRVIASGDMEQLAQIVLNGDGQKLLEVEAPEPEIQAFLRNIPNYMEKIRRVHEASRSGSLLNLQQALDRRKFAIAKDEISPNGATPLHVAVLFGHSDIVRYLAARFPETTTIADSDGRTALHYAAVINDNGHFYNVLLQLGANPKELDKMGKTPEQYLGDDDLKESFNYGLLLKNFGAENLEAQLLSDQVPDDLHSSRRILQDGDVQRTLERCFSVIQESSKIWSGTTASALAQKKPLTGTSLLQVGVTGYLSRFLKPSVFEKIKRRQTRLDHNLFDVLWPALRKTSKDRHLEEDINSGLIAPDFDVYVVFQEFLVPLIKDMHCMSVTADFKPHPRIAYFPMENAERLNTAYFVFEDDSNLMVRCLVECSRNLDSFELPLNLTIGQIEQAERLVMAKIFSSDFIEAIEETEPGSYYTLSEVLEDNSDVYDMLSEYGLLIPLLDIKDEVQSAESAAFNGMLWPYGRGVYISCSNNLALWLNCQEHLRIISTSKSKEVADIGSAYTRVGRAISFLEQHLHFKESYLLGYLQSRASYLGTGLKMTTIVRLPNLMKEMDNLRHLCSVRGLHLQSNRQSKLSVQLINMQSMGSVEHILFQDYCTAVTNILSLEKDMSLTNSKHIATMLIKIFRRKKNSLAERN